MNFEIELEHNQLKRPEKLQTGNPEKDYYLDIIFKLELRAYDELKSRKRNPSGYLGNTKENRWKQASAEFFNSLASQGRSWLDGGTTFPNPWSFKQWRKIRFDYRGKVNGERLATRHSSLVTRHS